MQGLGVMAPIPEMGWERALTYHLATVCRKLQDNEENWTGKSNLKFCFVDPPLLS